MCSNFSVNHHLNQVYLPYQLHYCNCDLSIKNHHCTQWRPCSKMLEIMSHPLPLCNLTVAGTFSRLAVSSQSVSETLVKCVGVGTWSRSVHELITLHWVKWTKCDSSQPPKSQALSNILSPQLQLSTHNLQ